MNVVFNIFKRLAPLYLSYTFLQVGYLIQWDGEIFCTAFVQLSMIMLISAYLFFVSLLEKWRFSDMVEILMVDIKE